MVPEILTEPPFCTEPECPQGRQGSQKRSVCSAHLLDTRLVARPAPGVGFGRGRASKMSSDLTTQVGKTASRPDEGTEEKMQPRAVSAPGGSGLPEGTGKR